MLGWKRFTELTVDKLIRLGRSARIVVDRGAYDQEVSLGGEIVELDASQTLTLRRHSGGKTLLLKGTGAAKTYVLPKATGSGARLRFIVGEVNTSSHIIKVADAVDVLRGNIHTNSTADSPDLAQPWPTSSTSDTITLNGTTTGGQAVGDIIELTDIAPGIWQVIGFTTSSGTEATPFSATVS
jgi:hypothetical protein